MSKLRIGVLGMSDGNGHPYSWSAIFNGYNPDVMKDCPFPGIPAYLSKRRWPEDRIHDGEVTHVWTQDRKISEHIAAASLIANVVDRPKDMIGKIDAVLLARDDDTHLELGTPYIEAGLPIFIDKPFAPTVEKAERLWNLERYPGQIFTGSSNTYATEFTLTDEARSEVGKIVHVDAVVMKYWDRYAPHVVEATLKLLPERGNLVNVSNAGTSQRNIVTATWSSGVQATFSSLGNVNCLITLRVFGEKGFRTLVITDYFTAFKESLVAFVQTVRKERAPMPRELFREAIRIIELGSKARRDGAG